MKKKVMFTEELGIKAYIMRKTSNLTQAKIGKKLGVCEASARIWARKVASTPKLKAEAEKQIQSLGKVKNPSKTKSKLKNTNKLDEVSRLMTENAYLRWWNLGLQEGFITRLLSDMKR
jgi:hypothetical protein